MVMRRPVQRAHPRLRMAQQQVAAGFQDFSQPGGQDMRVGGEVVEDVGADDEIQAMGERSGADIADQERSGFVASMLEGPGDGASRDVDPGDPADRSGSRETSGQRPFTATDLQRMASAGLPTGRDDRLVAVLFTLVCIAPRVDPAILQLEDVPQHPTSSGRWQS